MEKFECLTNMNPFQPLFSSLTETGHIDPVLIERYNTPGFVGCLSRVQFNGVAPLKSALRSASAAQASPTDARADSAPAAASPASHQGKLLESNCGASPLTIPPMSAATDPWHLDNTGEEVHPASPPLVHTHRARSFGDAVSESTDRILLLYISIDRSGR